MSTNPPFPPSSTTSPFPPSGPSSLASVLPEGLRLLVQFLVDHEAEYLCGVPLKSRSDKRLNSRTGHYERKIATALGTISIRMPHLRYLVPRVSIAKRAKRLAPEIFKKLSRILVGNTRPQRVSPPLPDLLDESAALIKMLWTVKLPRAFLATLAGELSGILEQWRDNATQAQ